MGWHRSKRTQQREFIISAPVEERSELPEMMETVRENRLSDNLSSRSEPVVSSLNEGSMIDSLVGREDRRRRMSVSDNELQD